MGNGGKVGSEPNCVLLEQSFVNSIKCQMVIFQALCHKR